MSTRITEKMMSSNYLTNLNTNLGSLNTIQQQMATQKLVNKASDNPLVATKVMQINTAVTENKQYNTNITNTINCLSTTDSSLTQLNSVLQRINELLVSTGDASYGSSQLSSIKDEINTNIGSLSQIINTNYDGKYIFGGTNGTAKPTSTSNDPTTGDSKLGYLDGDGSTVITSTPTTGEQTTQVAKIKASLSVDVSQGVSVNYNITAGDILEYKDNSGISKDLRATLANIVSDLGSSSATGRANLTGTDLSDIQSAITNISSLSSKVGALENRMTSASTQNSTESANLTDLLSSTDDVDVASLTIQYSTAQSAYQASLQISAKILQKSLMDYLN